MMGIMSSFDLCCINTDVHKAISIRQGLKGNHFLLYLPRENNHEKELIFSASHSYYFYDCT